MTDTKKPAIATRMHHNNRALNLSYLNENPVYFKMSSVLSDLLYL